MTNKNRHKLFGIIVTIVFHSIAVVLLFTLCFRTPLPLPGEAGVEVNLGMYASASVSQQVNETVSQQEIEETEKMEEIEETEETEEILSEDEEIPSIEEEKKEVEEIEEEKPEEVIEEKPIVNQRAMFKGPKEKQGNTSKDNGENEDDSESGAQNGLKNIERYEGNGGSGDGPAFDLGGRGAKSISSPTNDFDDVGKIVVDIWVDKEGRVQRAEIGKGTDIYITSMRESALQAAKNSIFNKDDKAADLQRGTITYTFIRKK